MDQKSLTVGVLGPKGSYTEQAALCYFKDCAIIDNYLSPQDIIEDVSRLVIDYGVVPVENSIQGGVASTIDALIKYRVNIVGEIVLPINHVLAAHPKAEFFRRVLSHEQALNQCKDYLKAEYPHCALEPTASTSLAAKIVSEKEIADALVICSEHAAKTYKLKIIAKHIASTNNNETRFFVIGNSTAKPTVHDKTSIVFGLIDRPGALYDALGVFKKYEINLTRIESRPTKKKLGDYLFIIDFEGHKDNEIIKKALEELSSATTFIKILGSYGIA